MPTPATCRARQERPEEGLVTKELPPPPPTRNRDVGGAVVGIASLS